MRPRASSLFTWVVWGVFGSATGTEGTAWAQGSPTAASMSEQMVAQSLFDEGRQLMDRGDYSAACPKLEESQRLDPGGGTFLNLALCHEKADRLGTAYLEMKEAASQAVRDGRKDRETIAIEHLTSLASRVPRLAVHPLHEEPELEVKVDGTILRKPAWDVLTVVDPGSHVIEASAPGRTPFRQTITVAEREQRTVHIPALLVDSTSAGDENVGAPNRGAKLPRSTRTNPWFIASIATSVTGFTVAVPSAYVWMMMKLTEASCGLVRGGDGFLCVSDGTRNAWLGAAAVGFAVTLAGTAGLVAFPSRIRIAPTASGRGGGATILGEF